MEASALDSVLVPEIGKYHLVAELARGGMGIVHLAAVQGPGGFQKLLVVKELKPELAQDPSFVSMFLDEARLAARLTHPNIVQTLEVGSEGGRHYMVMEYLDGRSLYRVIRRCKDHGGFPVAAHLRILAEMLLGLHYAHELTDVGGEPLGIVHRDVSPLNVLVTFDGQAKLLDFGIAKSVDSSLETKAGTLKGRIAYMAPEQALGSKVDRRADVYSAGVMIWEAAAGRRLWPGLDEVHVLARLLREGSPPLRSVRPDCPQELEAICARALAKRAEDRYPTAEHLLADLEAHLAKRGDAMSMREVGALVGRLFADERRRTAALLEETLVRVRGGPRSGVMPTLELHRVRGTPSGFAAMCDVASPAPPERGHYLDDPSHVASSPRLEVRRQDTRPEGKLLSAALAPAALLQSTPPLRRRAAIAGAAASISVLVVVLALRGFHEGGPARESAPTPAGAPSAPPTREASELIDLVVRVSPPGALVTIDGASITTNPFHGRYSMDSLVHHVSATADGYEPKIVDVTFVRDASVDISLERQPQAPAPRFVFTPRAAKHVPPPVPPGTSEPAPTPPAHSDVSPAGGQAPLRPILTSNPYGNAP